MTSYREGDKSRAICQHCCSIVSTTFRLQDVRFSDERDIAQDVLVAVCDTCDMVVAIPAQSTFATWQLSVGESEMNDFEPDARKKRLIEQALKAHRKAQAKGRYAPRRLVERWSSEAGIERPEHNQKKKDDPET